MDNARCASSAQADRLEGVAIEHKSYWNPSNDEFTDMIELGIISPSQAQTLLTEGEKVIRMAANDQSPFCDGWECWSPPGTWQIPEFPANWEQSI